MKYNMKLLAKTYDVLQDDESKNIFDLRFKFAVTRDKTAFTDDVIALNKPWHIVDQCDNFQKLYKGQKIVIFGAGNYGRMTKHILSKMGVDIFGFCDNDKTKWGGGVEGEKKIYSLYQILALNEDFFFIIATARGGEIYAQLLANRIDRDNVFLPMYGQLYAIYGNQYFDCPNIALEDDEIFVDMGMYDGMTSLYVAQNCRYKKIIGFEASEWAINKYHKKLSQYENIKVYPYAAWNKREDLSFVFSDAASHVGGSGNIKVVGEALDNVLNGERATFIKMDIEGAEYNALLGAKKTIQNFKPKLAISVYHKPDDIVTLPTLILELRDDYKFYLRHYGAFNGVETILYAH